MVLSSNILHACSKVYHHFSWQHCVFSLFRAFEFVFVYMLFSLCVLVCVCACSQSCILCFKVWDSAFKRGFKESNAEFIRTQAHGEEVQHAINEILN